MNTIKKFAVALSILCCLVYAQANEIDSLKNLLNSEIPIKQQAEILNKLAFYTSSNNPELSLSYAKQALQLSNKHALKDEQASAYSNLSQYYKITSVYDSAVFYSMLAIPLFDETNQNEEFAQELTNLGNIYMDMGEYILAEEVYKESLVINTELQNDEGIAHVNNNLGVLFKNRGKYSIAIEYYIKALEVNKKLKKSYEVAQNYNNIGGVYYYWNHYDQAIEYFKLYLTAVEKMEKPLAIAGACNNIGSVYIENNEYSKSLEYYLRAYSIYDSLKIKMGVAILSGNLGLVYEKLGNYNEALRQYKKALSTNLEIGNSSSTAHSYLNLGSLYNKLNKPVIAQNHLFKAEQIAQKINHQEILRDSYGNLSESFELMGDFEKALGFQRQFNALRDSILNKENFEKFAELERKFETEQKEQEITLLNQEKEYTQQLLKKQQLILYIIISSLLILIILLLLILRQKQVITTTKNKLQVEQNKILDSIKYASRIQSAIFPPAEQVKIALPEHFIFYQPKDIVSGDFYWVERLGNEVLFSVADCTGHGVPGALMSMLGISYLNDIIHRQGITHPSDVLNELRANIIRTLHQDNKTDGSKDGIDLMFCKLNTETMLLEYCGASSYMFVFSKNILQLIKSDRIPIGFSYKKPVPFETKQLQLNKGDKLFMFSDGFIDQFGGNDVSKFKLIQLKTILENNCHKSMNEISNTVQMAFMDWKGDIEQIDDVLLLGIKV